ncbi:hypothetical protein HDV00_009375 [Rhizophlyctis rosea]|nr:hypothetical protein HDV00_009375 [Rhizophlyctis rosea]
MSTSDPNYAALLGITAVPALVFLVAYGVLLLLFNIYLIKFRGIRGTTASFVLFCILRVGAFVCRYLSTLNGGSNYALIATSQTLLAVGFVILLRIEFRLLCNWEDLSHKFHRTPQLLNKKPVRIFFLVIVFNCVWIAVTAGTFLGFQPINPPQVWITVRNAVSWILCGFHVVIFLVETVHLVVPGNASAEEKSPALGGAGPVFDKKTKTTTMFVLWLSGLVLCVRVGYSIYYIFRPEILLNEVVYFCTNVLPELLFVLLWAVPSHTLKLAPSLYEALAIDVKL